MISRIKNAVAEKYGLKGIEHIDYSIVPDLSQTVAAGWKVTAAVWKGKEIIDVFPGMKENLWGSPLM